MSPKRRTPGVLATPAGIRVPDYATPAPVQPITPPLPPATLGLGGNDYEWARVPVQAPSVVQFNGLGTGFGPEVTVFSSTKPWKGCDVYVTVPRPTGTDKFIRLAVYAIVNGVRTEVDSSYVSLDQPGRQIWCCAGRANVERWEVTFQYFQLSLTAPGTETYTIEAIASDKITARPARDGAQLLVLGGGVLLTGAQLMRLPKLRLAGYAIANGEASARFLQFFNGTNTGTILVHSAGCPAGGFVEVFDPDFLGQFTFENGFAVGVSSSASGFVSVVDDVGYSLWVK